MQRIFKQASVFPFVVLSILCTQLIPKLQFVEKLYSENICTRKHTAEDLALSLALKDRLLKNPLVCIASSKYVLFRQLTKSRNRKAAQSWKAPQNLPDGSQVTYCSDLNKCCKSKKSLNSADTHYSLCRECIHLVTLPASCTPRQLFHITCQDPDHYDACFSSKGRCATNLLSITVVYNSKDNVCNQRMLIQLQ
ncbi:uncharacterized protein LOC101235103 isoform X3 [Hydra vulgaris]|uniref:Uncharacterized protein LOC101235103 isoform X3 n=1 Tax=Hydra vulgaris TaxID=6087 RepID=A0ABM4CCP2_HYDVU